MLYNAFPSRAEQFSYQTVMQLVKMERNNKSVFDEAYHRGIICKLDDGVGTLNKFAVMGEEGVEERTHITAL